jgi:hypothetical protein
MDRTVTNSEGRLTNQRSKLDIQLDAYSETCNKSAGRNWQAYAAATGAALAAATVAAAGIITGTGPIVAGPVTRGLGAFDANQNVNIGSGQIQLRVHYNAFNSSFFGSTTRHGNAAVQGYGGLKLIGLGSLLKNFASGASIHNPVNPLSSVLLSGAKLVKVSSGFGTGNFNNGATGIAGFQLNNGDLGWIKLKWASGDAYPSTLTALSWAYNTTPGAAILAGDSGAVPEPGTASMALLATGAAGLLAWRRRRRHPASQG